MLTGKVLITGGSGFLGRAILRSIKYAGGGADVTIYSRDEFKQFNMAHDYPQATYVLGDVRDEDRLVAVMAGHDTVIHAGAVKFIPEAEHNVAETIAVNVNGSANVARAAVRTGVKTVVGISTDKACAPLNTYGMTKALMERLFAEANRWGSTRFVTVRYGNVVGSTGSVIPLFRRQLAESNRMTVTDPEMTRFWLSADEAVLLISRALEQAADYPGHTFIPTCPAMRIEDVAQAVWTMYGNKGMGGVGAAPIVHTGIRPGEKLHEELFNEQEAVRVYHPSRSLYVLAPAIVTPGPTSHERKRAYSSAAPASWMTVDEMIECIKDAETI